MIAYILFFFFVALALLGDARIFLFVMNRVVFGSHRHEKSPWGFLLYTVPPALLFLTALFWPLHRWIRWLASQSLVERLTPQPIERIVELLPLARIGAAWLFIAAGTGIYWIVDRVRVNASAGRRPAGVRSETPEVIRLRKAHVPWLLLRKLGAHNDIYDIEVTRHELFIDDLPEQFDGYRIAFLTDTHVAPLLKTAFYREVVARANAFDPDLILLGGDFVTWHRHIKLMAEVIAGSVRARDGVFAVLGNHDYWAGGDDVRGAMEARGVQFLINRSAMVQRDGVSLPVIGIDEVYRGEPDVTRTFEDVPPGPCIGVTHHPDLIGELEGRRIDLLLVGHTHGGQIRFPFFGAVVVPSRHESRYAAGFHRVGGVLMYVSRGIGAIPPLRILCRPEVATFTLRRGRRQ